MMPICKWVRKPVVIAAVLILAAFVLWIALFVLFKVGPFFWRPIERDPDKEIARLERIFEIDFPEDIKDVRVARTRAMWDGCVSFIVKFAAEPNVVESFLKIKHLRPYRPENDHRGMDPFVPKWFSEPIKQGKMGSLSLYVRKEELAQSGRIYIDNSNNKRFVVYIDSAYDKWWDK